MKKIYLKSQFYELIDSPNVTASHLQASIKKEYSIDELLADLEDTATITIKENDETIAVYNGYSKMLAVCVYADSISVELINEDIQMQIDELEGRVSGLDDVQENQSQEINNLNDRVTELTPYRTTKQTFIGDTELIFENVPDGNLSVYARNVEDAKIDYDVIREGDRVIISFAPLDYVTNFTIEVS